MLKNIDANKFAEKLKKVYGRTNNDEIIRDVEDYISMIEEILEPAVLAWIEGREIPDIVYGEYSTREFFLRQPDIDFIYLMLIFSRYINLP